MAHVRIRRPLAWAVVGTLLLPIVLSLVLGLAGLLAGLGDQDGAVACRRAALAVSVLWGAAIVTTTTLTALAILAGPRAGASRCGPRRRRHRRRRLRPQPPLGGVAGDRPT